MAIDVTCEMTIYEVDGKETPAVDRPRLAVLSHWVNPVFVVLRLPGGQRLTVSATDLRTAIDNAANRGPR